MGRLNVITSVRIATGPLTPSSRTSAEAHRCGIADEVTLACVMRLSQGDDEAWFNDE